MTALRSASGARPRTSTSGRTVSYQSPTSADAAAGNQRNDRSGTGSRSGDTTRLPDPSRGDDVRLPPPTTLGGCGTSGSPTKAGAVARMIGGSPLHVDLLRTNTDTARGHRQM